MGGNSPFNHKQMRNLFTDQELEEILNDLKPIEIPMGDDEIHREELYWKVGCIEIYADVICVRKTIDDPETYEEYGYMRTDDGKYEYLYEIDEMAIYCDDEECSNYKQRDKFIIPFLNNLISVY